MQGRKTTNCEEAEKQPNMKKKKTTRCVDEPDARKTNSQM
jgi:hypothetical protein